jgi:hypothetical protein
VFWLAYDTPESVKAARSDVEGSSTPGLASEIQDDHGKRPTIRRNLFEGYRISGAHARLQAIAMSFERNQILSPRRVAWASKFVLALLLPPTAAAICPLALGVVLAEEATTAQQWAPIESHEAEQDQQQELGSAPASLCEALVRTDNVRNKDREVALLEGLT